MYVDVSRVGRLRRRRRLCGGFLGIFDHVHPVQRPRINRDAEGATLTRLGMHFDVAAQGLGQMLADAKAQSRAAELPRGRAIHLAERLEKFPDLFFVHADARVGHVEA